mmetsp:Transcript_28015/g.83715  ORF Transcript_28015/g.83715 Transcript_28015/m.83715 type:complete len:202 (-) Transcript_28015:77-682(-)
MQRLLQSLDGPVHGGAPALRGRIVVAAETEVAAPTQAAGFHRALQMLSRGFANGSSAHSFGLIMIARHDLLWTKSLTAWSPPADFGRTSAISRCERFATHNTPPSCVNDWAFAMPGPLFSRFVDTMRTCWRNTSHAGAHACGMLLGQTMPGGLGYLSVWQPRYRIRQLPSCDLAQPLSTVAWSSPGPRRLLIEAARLGAHT